jgi:glycosyltransferase involved in cell wall biosynthesis
LKVVIFIDWFTPAYKAGGPIQSILNLVNQPTEDTEYKIICSNKDLDGEPLKGVAYDEWVWFNKHTEVWYNSKNKTIRSILKKLAQWNPDILFINGVYSFYYNLLPILFGKASIKIISARGMLHLGALKQKSIKKRIYLATWKLLKIPQKNSFHATNEEEKRFIQALFGSRTKVFIAQNLPRTFISTSGIKKRTNSLCLISIGLVSPMKNYLKVLRALAACKEDIHYLIYGTIKDQEYWALCVEQIKKLPANIRVEYPGDLPSIKVHEALSKAHVFILPSKSENFGHAIYEALTAGKPVITSHNTPWNSLREAKAGWNVSLEKDYELSEAICFFAGMDNNELALWSDGAKKYAENAIDTDQIKAQYQKMFSGVME